MKQFISTCSASTDGPPRATKHCGLISRPQVAYDYLRYSAGIDVHNHVRTGSLGLEDVWRTASPHTRQFTGVLGFVFTNSYLAMKYFKKGGVPVKHVEFKMDLANQMVRFDEAMNPVGKRPSVLRANSTAIMLSSHTMTKYAGKRQQKPCYVCQHGGDVPSIRKTSYYCEECNVAICPPHLRTCWNNHLVKMPEKRRFVKSQ